MHQQDNSRLQQELRRNNSRASTKKDTSSKLARTYSLSRGSHSVSDLIFNPIDLNSTLKRSKTVPTKRSKFGEHEPEQVVFVNNNNNNNSSASCKNLVTL